MSSLRNLGYKPGQISRMTEGTRRTLTRDQIPAKGVSILPDGSFHLIATPSKRVGPGAGWDVVPRAQGVLDGFGADQGGLEC